MMNSRYGRIYKPRGAFAKIVRFLAVTALVLITLFFYLYFTWQKYIVYTNDGLYLDLPFMGESDKATGGKPTVAAGPVSDSLSSSTADGDKTEDDAAGESQPEDVVDSTVQTGEEDGTPDNSAADPDSQGDLGTSDDTAGTITDTATGDDSAQPGDGSTDKGSDGIGTTDQPALPAVTAPEGTAEDEDDKPDNGVKDSFI